jgi:hypothetical protein
MPSGAAESGFRSDHPATHSWTRAQDGGHPGQPGALRASTRPASALFPIEPVEPEKLDAERHLHFVTGGIPLLPSERQPNVFGRHLIFRGELETLFSAEFLFQVVHRAPPFRGLVRRPPRGGFKRGGCGLFGLPPVKPLTKNFPLVAGDAFAFRPPPRRQAGSCQGVSWVATWFPAFGGAGGLEGARLRGSGDSLEGGSLLEPRLAFDLLGTWPVPNDWGGLYVWGGVARRVEEA